MTIQEFSDVILPTLSQMYMDGNMGFHSLVDIDTWSKVFPDANNKSKDFFWYQIKINSFSLKDNMGLIVFTLPEPKKTGDRKFIGIRFDNKTRRIYYYILQRPKFYDNTWEIMQFSFKEKKFVFECLINGTHSMRNFVNTLSHRKAELPRGLFDIVKDVFTGSFQMQ